MPRNDLLPTDPAPKPDLPQPPPQDVSFDLTRTPLFIAFLRRAGLGFCNDPHDRTTEENPEADDLDVGPIGSLRLDLGF